MEIVDANLKGFLEGTSRVVMGTGGKSLIENILGK
jgi:hypothetical protein